MAMKPKKIMNVNRPEGLGGGRGAGMGSSVKQVSSSPVRKIKNKTANISTQLRKSGEAAKRAAADVNTGTPKTTIKIKSGGDVKPAFPKKVKPKSYNELKDMPNLIKIDSAKGNKIKKIAYRRRSSN
jgi:hypothetical protein